jgi:hypothetical protein
MKVCKKVSGSCIIPIKDILDARHGIESGDIVLWLASKKGCPCVIDGDNIFIDSEYSFRYYVPVEVAVCVVTWAKNETSR